jgi:hypothetical protein
VRARPSPTAGQSLNGELAIGDQHRGAFAHEIGCVRALVIVHRRGKRHENGADADRRKLRDRERAGAADHEVGPCVGRGHVVDEWNDAGAHAGARVIRARGLEPALARLMACLDADGVCQARKRKGHHRVQARRALAAAQHQQADGAAS